MVTNLFSSPVCKGKPYLEESSIIVEAGVRTGCLLNLELNIFAVLVLNLIFVSTRVYTMPSKNNSTISFNFLAKPHWLCHIRHNLYIMQAIQELRAQVFELTSEEDHYVTI